MFTFLKRMFGKKEVPKKDACILVVDDNEIDRKVIESMLNKRGYTTLMAENGERGLEVAKARHPSLIVLDCEMPVMTGAQMCERLKEDHSTQDIPVLFLTSTDTPKNIVECFQTDAENFLTKPVNPQVFMRQIDDILKEFLHKKKK
jgi:CheY-like chemotaxis protein